MTADGSSLHDGRMNFGGLEKLATRAVREVLTGLPKPLRERARSVAVHLSMRPEPGHIAEGIDPDVLGLFEGEEYAHLDQPGMEIPTRIILFLENIWDYAERRVPWFLEEVRTTYLHELGHYLGLDEDDLEDRGLE